MGHYTYAVIGNQAMHCVAVLLGMHRARTQLSEAETVTLLNVAKDCIRIAEIGVFEGATMRRLAEVMPDHGVLYAIDPFLSGRLGIPYGYCIARSQAARVRRSNINFHFVRKLSYEYAPNGPTDLDLVFIDADHRYESVCKDWADWSPKVREGGFVALHDSQPVTGRCAPWCGPVKLVAELGEQPPGFQLREVQETLTIYMRVN